MKELEFTNLGFIELESNEQNDIDGGVFGLDDLAVGIVAGLVISAIDHWSDIKKGVSDALK